MYHFYLLLNINDMQLSCVFDKKSFNTFPIKQIQQHTSTEKLYSGGPRVIFSGVFLVPPVLGASGNTLSTCGFLYLAASGSFPAFFKISNKN
jgi:hypothetical protein